MDSQFSSLNEHANTQFYKSKILEENCFYITTTFQEYSTHKCIFNKMHFNDCYVIIWITKGDAIYKTNHKEFPIHGHAILFIAPKEFHSFSMLDNCEGISIVFTANYFSYVPEIWKSYVRLKFFNGDNCIQYSLDRSIDNIQLLLRSLQKQYAVMSTDFPNDFIGLYSSLTLLLHGISKTDEFKLRDNTHSLANAANDDLYLSFLDMVEDHYCTMHNVREYARQLGICIAKLETCCKECCGHSPKSIIMHRIATEAISMLSDVSIRSNEVGYYLGFKEHSNFVNFFKKYTGLSPTDYRNTSR